jgi:hypothetical protein
MGLRKSREAIRFRRLESGPHAAGTTTRCQLPTAYNISTTGPLRAG